MSQVQHDISNATPKGMRPDIDISKWVWFIPSIALLLAVLPLPYGYYMFLRIIVAGCAGYLAWREYSCNGDKANSYTYIFGFIALLYNPILPVYLFKLLWIVINLGTAAVFIGHCRQRMNN